MNEFEPLKGYEKLYAINREGSVWSCFSKRTIKPYQRGIYATVCLCKCGKLKTYRLHRLIATHFIPNPLELPCVDHINGNPRDNRIENLRWVSYRQNNLNKISKPNTYIQISRNGKFQVVFNVNGTDKDFGTYKTLDEALSERDCALDCEGLLNYCYGLEPVNDYL